MPADAAQAAAHGRAAPALPVLLADRQGVAFVATPRGIESLRIPRRYWGPQVGVVPIPVSDEEVRGAEFAPPGEAGTWPRAVPRPDLLVPALSRLLNGDHVELSLQPSRDGLKAQLVTAQSEEQPFPIAPKDAIGFLAAVFGHAPRGVIRTAGTPASRLLLSVRPAARRSEYRVRLAGVVEGPQPPTLADAGMSPATLELVLERLERPVGIFLVSGGSTSGRSTTLELLAATLKARGRSGGRIGARGGAGKPDLPWLAETLSDWPFPESLLAGGVEFVLLEQLGGEGELALAARLAAGGCLALAAAPAGDAEALARAVARDLEEGAAPAVPVVILSQAVVRTVCRSCIGWQTIPAAEARRHGFHRRDLEEIERRGGLAIPVGKGCGDCAYTGARGLTGVFELVGPDRSAGSLPRMREEGWRKVLQGAACFADVTALPGAHRPLRSLREVLVHAGLGSAGSEGLARTGEHAAGDRAQARQSAARPGSTPAAPERRGPPAASQAVLLSGLFKAAASSRAPEPGALAALAKSIAAAAAAPEPIEAALAPAEGFQLASHSVNAARIAARIASHLGVEVEIEAVARLALLHDAGLIGAEIDPAAEVPPVLSEEMLDPQGSRLQPRAALKSLGADPELEQPIRQVHAIAGFEQPSSEERGRADVGVQAVALACLVDLHMHGPGDRRPADAPDVTSLIMEQHGRRFSPLLFRALLKAIPIFPIGSLVELSSGDLARVVSLNQDNHFRPRVEIAAASGGDGLGERRVVDLARAPFLHIRQRVPGAAPAGRARS
ncbi:MAG: hypothetical protein HY510_00130 [Acidobacteria bacterium]|nr:hypothetical protein [Acidobacteriota bacterium]